MQGFDDPNVSAYTNERLYLPIVATMSQATTNTEQTSQFL